METIEPPIVKLKSGSLVRVESIEEALKVKGDVDKILFLGDLLVSYAEFYENDKPLIPSSFVEEWWAWELEAALARHCGSSRVEASKLTGLPAERIERLIGEPLKFKPTVEEALKLSETFKIPLHPKYTYFWRNLSPEEILRLRRFTVEARVEKAGNLVQSITYPEKEEIKILLEKLLLFF